MFILDDQYVSKEVLDFLEESGEPVLDTPEAKKVASERKINICSEDDAKKLEGKRICALSEVNLESAMRIASPETKQAILTCKDKAYCRRILSPLFPDYYFIDCSYDELFELSASELTYPIILKPAVGFFSMGVYPIFNENDWSCALRDIKACSSAWEAQYNSSVVKDDRFIIESYIEGEEFALDAYFDNDGNAVVLDILKHDFSGTDDVSDRLYYTSGAIIKKYCDSMTVFLNECNSYLKFTNFPLHVEVRIDKTGRIIPVEFNPLRFAGMCSTDVSYFAYSFKTYEAYLNDYRPNWDEILKGKDGLTYTMLLISGGVNEPGAGFDYDELLGHFRKVLALRKTDFSKLSTFGFLFTEIHEADWEREAGWFLNCNLNDFVLR